MDRKQSDSVRHIFAFRLSFGSLLFLSLLFGLLPMANATSEPWSNIYMNSTNARAGEMLQMTFKDLVSEVGITSIDLGFIAPSQTNWVHSLNSFIIISGTIYSGTWRTDFKVPETAEMGTWTTVIWVHESKGNATYQYTGPNIHVGPLSTVTPPISLNNSWITVNLSSVVSNSQIGIEGLDICGYHFTPGFLTENQSVSCDKSFLVDLGQFFAATSGLVQQDISLCGIRIRAGTTVGFGVMLNCVSPADKAAADARAAQQVADAAAKAAADALAAQQAADSAAKALADKASADALASQKAAATKAALQKKTTITCIKGKLTKTVTAIKPTCPAGYKKK